LKRSDLLFEKTSIAIQPGSEARGWLAYRLTNATLNIQQKTRVPFVVSFLDVNGKRLSATNCFWKGNVLTNYESLELPLQLPGSGNLVLTNIQLLTTISSSFIATTSAPTSPCFYPFCAEAANPLLSSLAAEVLPQAFQSVNSED
jgi:hypothetical protein